MSDFKEQLTAELLKHADATVEMEKSPGRGFYFVCDCGHRELKTVGGKREWLAAHNAETLASVIVTAQAKALFEAAETLRADPSAQEGTPKYMRNLIYATWLLERANELVTP